MNSMTHKDLDSNKVNMNHAYTKLSLIQDLTIPKILLSVRTKQFNVSYVAWVMRLFQSRCLGLFWLVSKIKFTGHIDEHQRHSFIHFPCNFWWHVILGTCEWQCRMLTVSYDVQRFPHSYHCVRKRFGFAQHTLWVNGFQHFQTFQNT